MSISILLSCQRRINCMINITKNINPCDKNVIQRFDKRQTSSSSSSSMLATTNPDGGVQLNQPIASSEVVRYSMDCLISLHDWLNIPWFAEIALVTILARSLIAFPLTVLQRKILLRYAALRPEIELLSKNIRIKIKEEAYYMGLSQQKMQRLYRKTVTNEINRLIARDNCHPFKASLVVMFQIPLWIILSNSYRNMATMFPDPTDPKLQMAHEQLAQEGCLWFKDLTVPDPTGLLPIMNCIINLTIIQIHVNERKRNNLQDSNLIKVFTNGGRLFSLILVPIGLAMPADLTFYWFISSSFGLVQNILLMNPRVKTFLKL